MRLADQGGSWRCATSRVDPRFTECRGVTQRDTTPVTLTASLVNGAVAVMLLSAVVDNETGGAWLRDLATRYGEVAPRVSGGLAFWQWVRRGRMIRLTTRLEGDRRLVSVSLVDGHLLDGLDQPPGLR